MLPSILQGVYMKTYFSLQLYIAGVTINPLAYKKLRHREPTCISQDHRTKFLCHTSS